MIPYEMTLLSGSGVFGVGGELFCEMKGFLHDVEEVQHFLFPLFQQLFCLYGKFWREVGIVLRVKIHILIHIEHVSMLGFRVLEHESVAVNVTAEIVGPRQD